MIQLKFVSSPDEDLVGEGSWHLDSLWLGRSKKCDVCIEDPECALWHLHIRLEDSSAFCELGPKAPYFHVNGKKVAGKKLLRPGDALRAGGTELVLAKYEYRPAPDISSQLEKRYLELVKASADHQKLLERLEREILAIERELNA